jgi:hypothetical protein
MTTHELSLEWLQRARDAVNADPSFRKRGSIDTTMAVRVEETIYLVTFGGFSCHDVRAITAHDLRDADFIVEMSNDQWNRYLSGRRSGKGRSLVEIDTTDGVVKAQTPRKQLEFLRYHTSIQAFFDAGCAARAA